MKMPDGHQTPRAQQMPQNMELVKFFRDEVGMEQEDAAFCSDVCEENYGVKEAHDLKYLTDKDMRKIVSKCRLLKAPAGKLMDTWKGLVGITEGPDHVPELSDATYIDHARKLLTQIYYRQNMYVMSAQFYDHRDLTKYLGPIIVVTSLSSFLGFLSSSSIVDDKKEARTTVALLSGLAGVIATTMTALRNAQKFDVKAEMFRSAAGQYRILATKLEQRIRLHRHLLNEFETKSTEKDPMKEDIKKEKDAFIKFFMESYERIITAQGEMKYFAPQWKLREWLNTGALKPNPIDQPMARFKDKGYALTPHEKERALFALTNPEVSWDEFKQAIEEEKKKNE